MRRLALTLFGREVAALDLGQVQYVTESEDEGHLAGDHMGASTQYGFTMPTMATSEERWDG